MCENKQMEKKIITKQGYENNGKLGKLKVSQIWDKDDSFQNFNWNKQIEEQ